MREYTTITHTDNIMYTDMEEEPRRGSKEREREN
jgi:hypothetical protein